MDFLALEDYFSDTQKSKKSKLEDLPDNPLLDVPQIGKQKKSTKTESKVTNQKDITLKELLSESESDSYITDSDNDQDYNSYNGTGCSTSQEESLNCRNDIRDDDFFCIQNDNTYTKKRKLEMNAESPLQQSIDDSSDKDLENISNSITQRQKETKRDKSPRECFGCGWTFEKGSNNPHVETMLQILSQSFMKASNDQTSILVAKFYKEKIYKPSIKAGINVPKWTRKDVKRHIEEHILDPRVLIGQIIKFYKGMLKVLQGRAGIEISVVSDDTGSEIKRKDINFKALKEYKETEKRLTELLKIDLTKMNFYDPSLTIDPTRAGNFLNLFNYSDA